MNKAKTQAEAREQAIDFQEWASKETLSYGELMKYEAYFTELAEEFDLVEEFADNAIISRACCDNCGSYNTGRNSSDEYCCNNCGHSEIS